MPPNYTSIGIKLLSSTGCVFGVIVLHESMRTEEWKVMIEEGYVCMF